jgi:hypothetical protein
MGSMTFHTVDATTGEPVANCEITADYNTSPCGMFDWGCTSGDGQSLQGYTDANGKWVWSIPYTCAGSFTNIVAQANGYAAQTYSSFAFGKNPGQEGIEIQMTPNSLNAPPGQGLPSVWDSIAAAFGYTSGQASSSFTGNLEGSGGWTIIAILVVVAIIIIVVAYILTIK